MSPKTISPLWRNWFFTLKGLYINSPGQNDEGVPPRVKKGNKKPVRAKI